ncbi:ribokinase [candidate division KSB3 bacterium]|uniref:Ribokinase n=1 Tax=candidate division KSB3 bacterium TaxID=2044937 RepID=A0A9D5JZ69_9BACT|nr:ribokinase [candidate division KSB3 bacterium]MBD3326497.1 ribokinase [candidate division KSB3 bacterium]
MEKRPHIVVIGSANIDLIMKTETIPQAGQIYTDGVFATACGGKGANQAVALARLDAHVEFIGRIGQDPFGDILRQNLEHEGVLTTHLIADHEVHTGTVSILINAQGDNAMVADYGSNLRLCPEDIDNIADVIRQADLVLLQCEVPEPPNIRASALAQDAGVPVIMNPASIVPSNLEMLRGISLITPNLGEAEALAALAGTQFPAAMNPVEKAEQAARVLRDAAGIERIIVTLGSQGAVYVDAQGSQAFEAFPITQVDVTGAGDCFTATIAYGMATGYPRDEAVTFASAAAALAVSRLGAQPSFPTSKEVQAFLETQTNPSKATPSED